MTKQQAAAGRDAFRSQWGFRLAYVGSALGMGNIWLFPACVSRYGGAAFLIPYILFVALILGIVKEGVG